LSWLVTRLLFVDDDERAHSTLAVVLPPDYTMISATTLSAAEGLVRQGEIDLVLLDINLPDGSGLDLLRRIQRQPAAPPTVMLTAFADVRLVVEAIRSGAADYVVKPYELNALLSTLADALGSQTALRDRQQQDPGVLERLAGDSALMVEVRAAIDLYAGSDAPVLVTGESGTGKELVAKLLHECSYRVSGPFVALNAAALPETLIESELFGSVAGAFTGAITRPGCFERADGGTLFLDEVGEMDLAAQAKLLRVIETKEVTPVGARQPTKINVRVVSATNRDPAEAVATGHLREDLYYRLCVLPVELPALRERRDDIPAVAYSLLDELQSANPPHERLTRIDASVFLRLREHDWPGNIRELRNVLERARLRAQMRSRQRAGAVNVIQAADLVL
jgi:two-component system response regulator AtoC